MIREGHGFLKKKVSANRMENEAEKRRGLGM